MARIRSIKPDFWTDEKIVELSPLARLLFIGMWNFVDDYGRAEYSPKRLKMQILPADTADISALIGEIQGKKLITVYQVDNKEYFAVSKFTKHQKFDKRAGSKIPPPPNPAESRRIPSTEVEVNKYLDKNNNPLNPPFDSDESQGEPDTALNGKKDAIPYEEIITHLNELTGSRFHASASGWQRLIRARWKEGFRVEDFKRVHETKCTQWKGNQKMDQYLTPRTLYRAENFDRYVNESNKPDPEAWRYE
ncbi:MAG: hypothetical protein C4555_03200 [Dehalococcoidia bacterium]|nr:MAG: hypothetical protein C4555_03200 [Dehalococcoidia bacterium]